MLEANNECQNYDDYPCLSVEPGMDAMSSLTSFIRHENDEVEVDHATSSRHKTPR